MQTEVRVAIHRRKHGDPDLTFSYRNIDLLKKLVPGLHILAVQERAEAEAEEVVVQQARHVSLRVHPTVVDEHVARWWWRWREGFCGPGAEDVAADVLNGGGGRTTLHGPGINEKFNEV